MVGDLLHKFRIRFLTTYRVQINMGPIYNRCKGTVLGNVNEKGQVGTKTRVKLWKTWFSLPVS